MQYLSSPTAALAQSNDIVYKFRPNVWTLVLAYQCLVMAMPVLKLLHVSAVSEWAWGWVTLPIWAPSALLAVVLAAEQVAQLGKAKASNLMAEPSAASY